MMQKRFSMPLHWLKTHGAEIILLHVVDGVGGQCFGEQSTDRKHNRQTVYGGGGLLTGGGDTDTICLRWKAN